MIDFKKIIVKNLEFAQEQITENLKKAGTYTSGATSAMFEIRNVTETSGQLWGWKYYEMWERGRKPNKNQSSVIGFALWIAPKLQAWAEAKGIKINPVGAGVNIARNGSKLHRQGGRNDIYTPVFAKLKDNLAKEIGNELIKIIIK